MRKKRKRPITTIVPGFCKNHPITVPLRLLLVGKGHWINSKEAITFNIMPRTKVVQMKPCFFQSHLHSFTNQFGGPLAPLLLVEISAIPTFLLDETSNNECIYTDDVV